MKPPYPPPHPPRFFRATIHLAIRLLPLGILACTALGEEARTWTQAATGRSIQGTLVAKSPDGTSISVRTGAGKVVQIKTGTLAKQDHDYLAKWTPPKPEAKGIVRGKVSSLTQAQGGKSRVMRDLLQVLKPYGEAREDTGPDPKAFIYQGPAFYQGGPRVAIPYLMPLDKALALLVQRPGLASRRPTVAPGFPPGMVVHEYDIRHKVYNRMFVVVDQIGQVVALQIKAETRNNPETPEIDWVRYPVGSTSDFLEPKTGGSMAYVFDNRKSGRWILIDLEARGETVLFLPQPMINLCLFHMEQDLRR